MSDVAMQELELECDGVVMNWNAAAAPTPALTVSEWSDEFRLLPKKSASRGGRWRTSATPYLRGIMDAIHEPGLKKLAVMKGAQVGASEALANIVGYHIAHDPCPMLLVLPTSQMAEGWSKDRLDDMIDYTDAIRAAINVAKSTLVFKDFESGFLSLAGANTPNSFARSSVRIAIGDDCDRFPPIVGDEGDPAELLVNRTLTFFDGITAFVSTPTLKNGRIDTLFNRGDQRRYFLTCPSCGRENYLTWGDVAHFRIGWDDKDASTARVECPNAEHGGCGAHLSESDRRAMVLAGDWMATAIPKEPGLVSFHLPGMLSTLGDVTLSSLVAKWFAALEGGRESLKVFINTQLGEAWEEKGTRMDPHGMMTRREDYGDGVEIPAWAAAVVAGVDVQDDRVEVLVTAFGAADERAVVDWKRIPGELKKSETQEQLLRQLQRKYHHASGIDIPVHAVCIDSGFQTDAVYSFVLANQARRIYATKGFAGKTGEPIVGKPSEKRTGKDGRPVALYPINVDDAKAHVMSSMQQTTAGPNCMHFPLHVDEVSEEFFAQLCAEHRETVYNKRKVATHQVWVKDRERNEALDASVLCFAAHRLINPNIRQMLEQIAAAAIETRAAAESASTLAPAPTKPKPVERRSSRSGYVGR